jgi:hypothetical protein
LAKPRTVALPDYPPSLLKPTDHSRGEVFEQLLDSLAEHYRLDGRFSDLPPPKPGDVSFLPDKELRLWMGLAWGLIQDFVPAFQEERKVGAPKQARTRRVWLFPHAHEARLVQIVAALRQLLDERSRPATNLAAYKALRRILEEHPAPNWRYGKLKSDAAFAQEWKKIPKHVKDDPDSHFPRRLPDLPPLPPEPDYEATPTTGAAVWAGMIYMRRYFRRSTLERLSRDLPEVPSKLSSRT